MDNEVIETLDERIKTLIERAGQLYDEEELEEKVAIIKRKAIKYVRENPIQCLLAGFTAGFLIARIFRSDATTHTTPEFEND